MNVPKIINRAIVCLMCLTVISGCTNTTATGDNTNGDEAQVEKTIDTTAEPTIEKVKVENAIDVKIADVIEGEFNDSNKLLGEVFANTNVSIFAQTNGTVSHILVKKGDTVKKGQVIAKLDQTDSLLTLQQAESALAVARANVEQANSIGTSAELAQRQLKLAEATYATTQRSSSQGIQLAQATYERAKSLYEKQAISKGELDQAKNAYLQTKNQYDKQLEQAESALLAARTQLNQANKSGRVAQATVKQAQADVNKFKNGLDHTLVKATVDGTITDLGVEPGDAVHAQKSIATIINLNPVVVKVNVSENMLSTFKKGTQLDITIPSQSFKVKGQVAFVGLSASAQSKLFPIEVEVANPKGDILAGMKAEVYARSGQTGILLPTDAIIDREDKTFVYVVQGDRVVQKEIIAKERGTDQTLVASGVKRGDKVVVQGQSQLKDGAKIRIVP